MRSIIAFALAALIPSAHGAITLDIQNTDTPVLPEQLSKRYSIQKPILNNESCYTAMTYVGTPPQKMEFVIDTGSTDVWMIAAEAPLCSKAWYKQAYHASCHTPCEFPLYH